MARRHAERRRHKRLDISCPLVVSDRSGRELFQIRAANISDGGLYLETPASNLPDSGVPDDIHLRISVPRSTPNTFMLEDFHADARVVRWEPLADEDGAGIAVQFAEPIPMDLSA